VAVELEWIRPKGDGASLRRSTEGEPIELRLAIKNLTDGALDLRKYALKLVFSIHAPSQPGSTGRYDTDPLGFWSSHESFGTFLLGGIRDADRKAIVPTRQVVCSAACFLRLGDETIDGRRLVRPYLTLGQYGVMAPLPAGETISSSIRIENLPANEYELAAAMEKREEREKGRQERIEVVSRALRLDVLQTKPRDWQGMTASLVKNERPATGGDGDIPVAITFTNSAELTQIFYVPLREGKIDFGEGLLCFDNDGQLLLRSPADRRNNERISLAPGEQHTFEAQLPERTKLARLAWNENVSYLKDKYTKNERRLKPGYMLSQHLLMDD
jgi:hypothetical protein